MINQVRKLPAGATLCAIGATGGPVNVEFFGSHTFTDAGAMGLMVGLVATGAIWMFRRWGSAAPQPVVASDSDALWGELDELEQEPKMPVAG